jgi:hypothetical protein
MESIAPSVPTVNNATQSILESLYNNKNYFIIIIIALIVLAGIGFYLYKKQFSKTDVKSNTSSESKPSTKEILQPNKEYYIIDQNGNPILVNKYFNNILHSENQSVLVNKEIALPPRPKLTHPNEETEIEQVNVTEKEDENVAGLDLTQAEIEELKKTLAQLESKQSAPITAQNEDDNAGAQF